MRILLLGDFSNVHATLGWALRELGHQVCVASDGDGWKSYPRDVDLARRGLGLRATLSFLLRAERALHSMRGYDVVQLISPVFLPLRAERLWRWCRQLRQANGSLFLGAFGMDRYYAEACLSCQTFRYSDFNLGSTLRHSDENDTWLRDWVHGEKGRLCEWLAHEADGIVSGLYEYDAAYRPQFGEKLRFIPFPIRCDEPSDHPWSERGHHAPLRFFIGIQRQRSAYKGTDIMLRALERVQSELPDLVEVRRAESVPFADYCRLFEESDVLLDQLYSYTPAMNALEAMARGLIVVGGGEPENYEILGETQLHPIINVLPTEQSVCEALRTLALRHRQDPDFVPRLSRESRQYVLRHHEALSVARRYLDFWQSRLEAKRS